eukprot:3726942-Ditylum_brightwellii.AAC.1
MVSVVSRELSPLLIALDSAGLFTIAGNWVASIPSAAPASVSMLAIISSEERMDIEGILLGDKKGTSEGASEGTSEGTALKLGATEGTALKLGTTEGTSLGG